MSNTSNRFKMSQERLDALKEELNTAGDKVDAAEAVQKSVKDAHDKVILAIDALEKLTAQAQIEKASYDALVEQYNQAMETYKEALAGAQAADEALSELAESVQRVIAAAGEAFTYRAPVGNNGVGNNGVGNNGIGNALVNAGEEGADGEVSEIPDGMVPLAVGLSHITDGEHTENAGDTEAIPDSLVPLASAGAEQSGRFTLGIFGTLSALFAALLLLFKRKKDDDEEEQTQSVR